MRLRLIACNVFQREVCHCLVRTPHVVDLSFVELGEHIRPDTLREILQREIDATAAGAVRHDAVLLLFGLCGNAAVGLAARNVPLILPRAHDCATLLLGSRAAFREHFGDHPSRPFGSVGYCERGNDYMLRRPGAEGPRDSAEYADYVARFGEEDARYIWETMHPEQAGEERTACYIRVPETDLGGHATRFRERAAAEGVNCIELTGSLRLIAAMIAGEWSEADFLRVAPGQVTRGVYDWDVVVRAETPA